MTDDNYKFVHDNYHGLSKKPITGCRYCAEENASTFFIPFYRGHDDAEEPDTCECVNANPDYQCCGNDAGEFKDLRDDNNKSTDDEWDWRTPPTHYTATDGDMQPWDVWKAFELDAWQANAVKYLLRAGRKGPAVADYRKARDYIDYLIAREDAKD